MKKNKKNKVQEVGSKELSVTKSPTEQLQEYLTEKGYIVYVQANHKQVWRARLVIWLAKLLKVSIVPAVIDPKTIVKSK